MLADAESPQRQVRSLLTEVLDIAGWPKRRFYAPRLRGRWASELGEGFFVG